MIPDFFSSFFSSYILLSITTLVILLGSIYLYINHRIADQDHRARAEVILPVGMKTAARDQTQRSKGLGNLFIVRLFHMAVASICIPWHLAGNEIENKHPTPTIFISDHQFGFAAGTMPTGAQTFCRLPQR